MPGVRVTLNRMITDGISPVVRNFDKGERWEYAKNGETRTLLITAEGEYDFIAEFAADAVESVEFI